MDEIINKPSMAHQKSPPKKTIKRKCKSAGSTAKIRKVVKEKFKHYDLFTYKKNKVTENIKSEENDSSQVNVMNRSNLMEFDSPDKTDIIGNISCNEQDFKIDKKLKPRKVSNMLKDTLINNSQNSDFEMLNDC